MADIPMRCFDCFSEWVDGQERFAVLNQMRDIVIPTDAQEPASFFQCAAYDPVFVCADCAGWYRDEQKLSVEAR